MCDQPLSKQSIAQLKDALDESDLTIKVDIVQWDGYETLFD